MSRRPPIISFEPPGYHKLVLKYEAEGMTTSDAQGCADVYFRDHDEWVPACKHCGDTGTVIVADCENGPEFDCEGPCENCDASEKREQAAHKEEARLEAEGWWMDPAGGWHAPGEDDPAAMYK